MRPVFRGVATRHCERMARPGSTPRRAVPVTPPFLYDRSAGMLAPFSIVAESWGGPPQPTSVLPRMGAINSVNGIKIHFITTHAQHANRTFVSTQPVFISRI